MSAEVERMVEFRPEMPSAAEVLDLGDLTIRSLVDGDVHALALAGELDLATAPRVETELLRLEASGAGSIVVDLRELTFIDSTGMRLMYEATRRMSSRQGDLRVLLRPGDGVYRTFEISGMTEMLPFEAGPPVS